MLSNELDILRSESAGKDVLLQESRTKHEAAIADRNALRAKLNRLVITFKDRQAKVDEQIGELDKLNAIINTAEKDMMRLKKQYEVWHAYLAGVERAPAGNGSWQGACTAQRRQHALLNGRLPLAVAAASTRARAHARLLGWSLSSARLRR